MYKIGIEAQRILRKKKHGMDMVALELIRNLQEIDKQNMYHVFVKPDEDPGALAAQDNFSLIELQGAYPLWEQYRLPREARRLGCDLLHVTSNTGPVRCKIPLITTLHDIIYLESISLFKKGGSWYQKLGNMYRRWVVPPVVKKSRKVITVSEFERERIGRFFGLHEDRLLAIYNGVGKHFRPVTDPGLLTKARETYRLPENFFFFLGNTDPKKNTPGVLKALALFNQKAAIKHSLVMLDFEEKALLRILRDIGYPELRSQIHLCGYVPNTELPAIISQSRVFLYPSLRESFGIPILEGMACGVPVITSNTSSMPEVAGDAALLVDPHQAAQIADALERVVSDNKLRTKLVARGLERARQFTWRSMAEKVHGLYMEVCEKRF